jgi:hypothetical protein
MKGFPQEEGASRLTVDPFRNGICSGREITRDAIF